MKILIAVDGSEYALDAIRESSQLLSFEPPTETRIITVMDNYTPMAVEPFISAEEFLTTVSDEMREITESNLSVAADVLRERKSEIDLETKVLMGSPRKTIVEHAEEWDADLIVMGSHGAGFWSRALLGSVSDSVLHHAKCSVFIGRKPVGTSKTK